MATPVVFNAVNYSIPAFGDVGYAQGPGNLSAYLIALASGTLQPTGGLFSLTSDANFGPNFGLVSIYFKSASANIAQSGVLRLANTDFIAWRNFANSADLPLAVNTSNQLTFNGAVISTAAIAGTVNNGAVGRLTLYPATGNTVDDVYVQNAQNIDVLIAPQATRTVALEYTIPNPGDAVAASTFALLQLAQTFTAAQTFAQAITITAATNQIVLGSGNTVTLTAPAPAASRVYTIPDVSGAANFIMSAGAQTIGGVKTFNGGAGAITMSASTIAMGTNKITGLANGTASDDAAAFGQITAQTATTSINGTFIGLGRNRIIGGEMIIDQFNSGALQSINAASVFRGPDANFTAAGQTADGVFSMQRVTTSPPTGFQNYLHFVTTTADASIGAAQFYYLRQDLEGYTVRDFLLGTASAVTFTFSFWVRSSLTGTFGGAFVNGASNRSYPYSYVINSANTWERKSITVVGDVTGTYDNTTGSGLIIYFDIGPGSNFKGTAGAWVAASLIGVTGATNLISTLNATWDVTGLQLEIGSVASAYEYRPFATELMLCQRYVYKFAGLRSGGDQLNAGLCYTTTNLITTLQFPVTMRVAPTATQSNPTNFLIYKPGSTQAVTSITIDTISPQTVNVQPVTAGGLTAGQAGVLLTSNTNAYVLFSASL